MIFKGLLLKQRAFIEAFFMIFKGLFLGGENPTLQIQDLQIESDILLLADLFHNFRNICLEIYEPDLAHFLYATGLAQKTALRKTEVKI